MNKNFALIFSILLFFLLNGCSFDNKTGIWSGDKKEKEKISKIETEQKRLENTVKIYTSDNFFKEEILPTKNIKLNKPYKNLFWKTSDLNLQNFTGNLYLSGIEKKFLKKRVGRKLFLWSKVITSPITTENSMILSDDRGYVYKINKKGKKIWKSSIYKKVYKHIYKNLSFSFYKNKIYIVDNLGFIYAISYETGRLIWIKNHGIPFKSQIKVSDNKIFVVNQDNRVLCFDTENGSKIWDIRLISSFIKSQNLQSLAVSKNKELIVLNSYGDLLKINLNNGRIYWSRNVLASISTHDNDFFTSSAVVIKDDDVIFSTSSSTFSFSLSNGLLKWQNNIRSVSTPILDGNNVFIVSNNGFIVNIDRKSGEIISSKNILKTSENISIKNIIKIMKYGKKKVLDTQIIGAVMGSGKIYSVTSNGYLIVYSAINGKVEYIKRIAEEITSAPIISNGSLYILTAKSRILGFR